ncbi:MAG TPA: HEAT repeat domain-containing protein [Planctomycetota bacterium]|nr:HEAT repeat domain-containing protein [Planctomycetota bacterium]
MQLSMNFRTTVALALLGAGGYYVYGLFFADIESGDLGKLMREHRHAEPARQAILKHRIMVVYNSARDYGMVFRALDSPSPATQALAVETLTEKVERRALPKLTEMLGDPDRPELVKEALATAMGTLSVHEAIPRLVDMTDVSEPPGARAAAHHALLRLTGAGAQVKLGAGTREQWDNWLRSRRVTGVR